MFGTMHGWLPSTASDAWLHARAQNLEHLSILGHGWGLGLGQ